VEYYIEKNSVYRMLYKPTL